MHVNKVHRVTTIDRVAADLGESVDWLHDVAMGMDAEDGVDLGLWTRRRPGYGVH
jgi:hypothetical protein